MANTDVIKPSYDALKSMSETIRAFSDLTDLIPDDDPLSSLWHILVERIEADMVVMHKEVGALWSYVPESQGGLAAED
jgi:hypothetical protein